MSKMWGRFNVRKAGNISRNPDGGLDNPGLYLGPGDALGATPPPKKSRGERNSFCVLTLEALPRVDHYKNTKESIKRPSLGELHGEPTYVKEDDNRPIGGGGDSGQGGGHGIKLGWIQGVLIPCLLNIWGVMLFLRLSWVVSQSGIGQSLVIIAISAIVCVITTLSLSAISTNGEVKGGGVYYIISRSLGPEFGASVGVILAFANAVAASMNTIGFCSSLNDLLKEHDMKIVDGGVNDIRIVGVCAIFIMIIICAIGMEWESKAQNILVVVIVGAILNFLVGAAIGPVTEEQKARGFVGFDKDVFASNWDSDYRLSENTQQDFFSVFSIFFPSVTGIQAGANISGDLKDPADAIPKGTLLALLLSMCSYALFVFFAGGAAIRDASGSIADYETFRNYTQCVVDHSCHYGLHNDYTIMQLMSGWGWLIYAGCFAATISTALTNLLSVPRLVQALGIDRVFPGLMFFSKGYGKAGEPYRGYVLTFFISSAFVLMADLNTIAPLISNFYLASYALINFCTFHAALMKSLGWRPTFKFYNMWVSLVGFFLCVVIMFLIDWKTSLITFAVFFVLYIVVVYRKPDANWGSSTQAQIYKTALLTVQKLANSNEHVKNYRPQLLVLSGPPQNRAPLIDLANLICKHNSLLVCAEILKEKLLYRARLARIHAGCDWLSLRKIKGFFTIVDGLRMEDGAKALMQATGVGKLRPNVLLMGYKADWQTTQFEHLQTYFNILHDAFANRLAVAILRVGGGLDYTKGQACSELIPEEHLAGSLNDLTITNTGTSPTTAGIPGILNGLKHADSNLSILQPSVLSQTSLTVAGIPKANERPSLLQSQMSWTSTPTDLLKTKKKEKANKQILHKFPDGQELHKDVLESMRVFDKKYKEGIIDVWWLYDDGGLTILLPYILSTRQIFSNCKLRIFALANRHHDLRVEELNMASLLSKFRIEYESLKMINNIMDEPKRDTQEFFSELLTNFRDSSAEFVINDTELATLKEKTDRQLRLRELLQEHSKESTLVVMSLPMPRKGVVSAPLYMAWLEAITRDMPPFLLVRGNQVSVLTFYS